MKKSTVLQHILSLLGNILSFIVMMLKRNRHLSMCVYMAALALSDSFMLYIAAHYWVATVLFKRDAYLIECKIFTWLFQVL